MDPDRAWADALAGVLRDLGVADPARLEPLLDPPADPKFGDATTSVALKLSKELKQPPRKIAERIAAALSAAPGTAKAEIAGAGFVNLSASRESYGPLVAEVLAAGPAYGSSTLGRGLRALVEHTSANPTGPLHIAHGRQAAVGDSLCRILARAGFEVHREFYVNDAGTQIENLGRSILWRHLEAKGVAFSTEHRGVDAEGKMVTWLVGGGLELLEKNAYRGDYIRELAKDVTDPTVAACGRLGKERLLADIRRDLADFRVQFDTWTSEEALRASGKIETLLEFYRSWGHSYPKDGALFLRSSAFGDPEDRALVKANGEYVYRTPDLAYHRDKFDRGWDLLVDTWGPDHHAEIANRAAGLKALGFNLLPRAEFLRAPRGGTPEQRPRCFDVLIVQHCRLLKDGQELKMGKRLATYVTLRELMDEVGVDATRWFFVMRKTDSHLDFDLSLAVKQSADNPVYYVQYAHARIASVLAKAAEKGWAFDGKFDPAALGDGEVILLRLVKNLRRAVERSAAALDPTAICNYATTLAAAYQQYQTAGKTDPSKRILVDDERARRARLAAVAAVRVALAAALQLVGVEAPERMSRDED